MRRNTLQIGLTAVLGLGLGTALVVADNKGDRRDSGATGLSAPPTDDFRSSGRRMMQQGTGPASCPGDLNDDGVVDGIDLAILLGAWATVDCAYNLAGSSCEIDGADLTVLLANWGDC